MKAMSNTCKTTPQPKRVKMNFYELNQCPSKALSRIISDSDPVLQRSLLLNEPLPHGWRKTVPTIIRIRDPYAVTFDGPDDLDFRKISLLEEDGVQFGAIIYRVVRFPWVSNVFKPVEIMQSITLA